MTRMFQAVILSALFLFCAAPNQAKAVEAAPAPSLVFNENGTSHALLLEAMDVHVIIRDLLAETTLTLTFRNPHDQTLEGEFLFPLPEGSTVSGYGLDIDGEIVEGAVVEKQKARVAFEKEVRKSIDPGLVEWVRGNNFRTRVYPILPNKSRTVMIRYVSNLLSDQGEGIYILPLNMQRTIADFHLKVEVVKGTVKPEASSGLANFRFSKWEDRFVAEAREKNFTPNEDLRIALPKLPAQLVSVEHDGKQEAVFVIHETPSVPKPPIQSKPPKRIGLFWDASLSQNNANREREWDFLRQLFARWDTLVVDVVVFRDQPDEMKTFLILDGKIDVLETYLNKEPLDGGTALGNLTFPQNVPEDHREDGQPNVYDLHLLMSDGLGNLGQNLPEASPIPLYTVASTSDSDHLKLAHIAGSSGGDHLNLSRQNPADAARVVGTARFEFLGAEYDETAISEVYPKSRQPISGAFQLSGRLLTEQASLVMRFGYRGEPEQRVAVTLRRSEASDTGLVPRFWAQQKVNELALFEELNKDELLSIGRRYGLVTPGTSLLVLENLEQHLKHDIEPAASRPEMRQAWQARKAVIEKESQKARKDRLERVVALWQARTSWWEKDFTNWQQILKTKRKGKAKSRHSAESQRPVRPSQRSPQPAMAPMSAPPLAEPSHDKDMANETSPDQGAKATITIKPWDPKTPYMATLKTAHARGRAYESYLDQRAGYGQSPAYYLDVANWYASLGEKALSHRILTSILDLGLDDPALLRVVAYRLMEQENWNEAVRLFEAVLTLRPEEPQSYRDLALALARRGEAPSYQKVNAEKAGRDLSKAMELLYQVVMKEWDRFEEIEVIVLEELNRLIAMSERLPERVRATLKTPDMDKRLQRLLDLDLRIVMTWDTDMTDIDIWVIEPTGEKADFSNRLTSIGGSTSRDFTQGYGPEEYTLRHLVPGAYRIQANYYGSSQQKLTGSITARAVVITNFGRANEKRQELTLRLPEAKNVVDIGTVELSAE